MRAGWWRSLLTRERLLCGRIRVRADALNRLLGFQVHHVEEASQRLEPVTAHQPSQFACQRGHIGGRLGAVAQWHLGDGQITDGARLGTGQSAIPDETCIALLSAVAIARAAKPHVLV